jgi:hypothetical protein
MREKLGLRNALLKKENRVSLKLFLGVRGMKFPDKV